MTKQQLVDDIVFLSKLIERKREEIDVLTEHMKVSGLPYTVWDACWEKRHKLSKEVKNSTYELAKMYVKLGNIKKRTSQKTRRTAILESMETDRCACY